MSKKISNEEIKKNSMERKLDRFIENMPYQIAENMKYQFKEIKKDASTKKEVVRSILQQVEKACDNIIYRANEIKNIS
jgi:hypothetical protein